MPIIDGQELLRRLGNWWVLVVSQVGSKSHTIERVFFGNYSDSLRHPGSNFAFAVSDTVDIAKLQRGVDRDLKIMACQAFQHRAIVIDRYRGEKRYLGRAP